MKVNKDDINGEVIRDTNVYTVIDNNFLNNLTLSKTVLHPMQQTSGHKHDGLEEVYFFNKGYGRMILDEEVIIVKEGDIVLIPAGVFHKVYNESHRQTLEFNCIFQSYER